MFPQKWADSVKGILYSGDQGIDEGIDAMERRRKVTPHKIVEIDFAARLAARVQPKYLVIPPAGLTFSVVVGMSGLNESVTLFEKGFKGELEEYAKGRANAGLDRTIEIIGKIEKLIDAKEKESKQPYPQDKLDEYAEKVQDNLDEGMTIITIEVKRMIAERVQHFKQGQKGLWDLEVKCYTNIATEVMVISVVSGVTAATHGLITPFAAVGIGRSGVKIAKNILVLATDCDAKAELIKVELRALKAVLEEKVKEQEPELKRKARTEKKKKENKGRSRADVYKTVVEVTLGSVSGLLGVDTPSLKNCRKLIRQHRTCIARIERKLFECAEEIKCSEARIAKKEAEAKGSLKAAKTQLAKIEEAFKRAETAKQRAELNDKEFTKVINDLSKGVPEWTEHVDTVVDTAVNIGMALGDFSSVVESLVTAFAVAADEATNAATEV